MQIFGLTPVDATIHNGTLYCALRKADSFRFLFVLLWQPGGDEQQQLAVVSGWAAGIWQSEMHANGMPIYCCSNGGVMESNEIKG